MAHVYREGGRHAPPVSASGGAAAEVGTVCAVSYQGTRQWCRAQVVGRRRAADDPDAGAGAGAGAGGDTYTVRYVDWGSYSSGHSPDELRQIRSDFMQLPFMVSRVLLGRPVNISLSRHLLSVFLFQPTECHLSNVIPSGGPGAQWTMQAALALEQIVPGRVSQPERGGGNSLPR